MRNFREWLRAIEWVPILASALVVVLALWWLAATQNYASNETADQEWYQKIFWWLSPEWLTAIFTGALFISTWALWNSTRTAANAARAAAEALPIVERAYVFREGNFAHDLLSTVPPGATAHPCSASYSIKNYGKTPAVLKRVWHTINYLPTTKFDGLKKKMSGIAPEVALAAGIEYEFAVSGLIRVDDFKRASEREGCIAIAVCIGYEDIFGKMHETAFCDIWPGKRPIELTPMLDDRANYRT